LIWEELPHLAEYGQLETTGIFPATDVCPLVAEYSAFAFDCALRGPFNNLRSAGSHHPGSLEVHVLFLSPHQRFKIIMHEGAGFVKGGNYLTSSFQYASNLGF
jgi:hypothetical protein